MEPSGSKRLDFGRPGTRLDTGSEVHWTSNPSLRRRWWVPGIAQRPRRRRAGVESGRVEQRRRRIVRPDQQGDFGTAQDDAFRADLDQLLDDPAVVRTRVFPYLTPAQFFSRSPDGRSPDPPGRERPPSSRAEQISPQGRPIQVVRA